MLDLDRLKTKADPLFPELTGIDIIIADGCPYALLGLEDQNGAASKIRPIAIRFDSSGNAMEAYILNNALGVEHKIDLQKATRIKEALLEAAGKQGAEFLRTVAERLDADVQNGHVGKFATFSPSALQQHVSELLTSIAKRYSADISNSEKVQR